MSETVETEHMSADEEAVRIRVPLKLKKPDGRKEIVLSKAVTGNVPAPDALVRAVARTFHRQSFLETGEIRSVTALVSRFHVDHSYVARTPRLAGLAPNIVESIVRGEEPEELTRGGPMMKRWPVRWAEQRATLRAESVDSLEMTQAT